MQDELFRALKKSTLVNSKGQTYMDFRQTLTPKWGMVWGHIGAGWLALIALQVLIIRFAGAHVLLDVLMLGFGSALIGYGIAYLQLFYHEAAHYNLHPDRKVNDVLCNIFVSGVVGQDIKRYRPIHWGHHRHLGSQDDTEISYFDPLNIKVFVTSLLGIRALNVIALRKKVEQESMQKATKARKEKARKREA